MLRGSAHDAHPSRVWRILRYKLNQHPERAFGMDEGVARAVRLLHRLGLINSAPWAARRAMTASMSSTWMHRWCMPGPCLASHLATPVSSRVGCRISISPSCRAAERRPARLRARHPPPARASAPARRDKTPARRPGRSRRSPGGSGPAACCSHLGRFLCRLAVHGWHSGVHRHSTPTFCAALDHVALNSSSSLRSLPMTTLRPTLRSGGMSVFLPTTVMPVPMLKFGVLGIVGAVADVRAAADDAVLVDDAAVDHGARLDRGVGHDDGVADDGAARHAAPPATAPNTRPSLRSRSRR